MESLACRNSVFLALIGLTFFSQVIFAITSATTSATSKEKDSFSEVFQKYNKSALISMDVTKALKSDLLGTEKTQKGKLYFSNEKFKIVFFEPQKEMILFDGKTLWTEQIFKTMTQPNANRTQVGKLAINAKNKSQIIISILFSNKSFGTNFERTSMAKKDGVYIYYYKTKNKSLNIFDLAFEVGVRDKEILKISYNDDVENHTVLTFSNILFSNVKQPTLFQYSPPKGAEVSNL